MTRIEKLVEATKKEILGKQYELSFAFISKSKIKQLNGKYRSKNEPTDILSFPLEKNLGEIFICKEIAKQKSKKFLDPITQSPINFENYLIFLVIHGCLHLKGLGHGAKMEAYELTHYSQYRRRHL